LKAGEAGVQGGALIPILPDRRSRLGVTGDKLESGRKAGKFVSKGKRIRISLFV
jgi:hypothetical protein